MIIRGMRGRFLLSQGQDQNGLFRSTITESRLQICKFPAIAESVKPLHACSFLTKEAHAAARHARVYSQRFGGLEPSPGLAL